MDLEVRGITNRSESDGQQEQTRQHTMKDGTVITQRLYSLEPGYSVWCPDKCCVFCKKFSDLFYDYTNGIYMFICSENTDEVDLTEQGAIGQCDRFIPEDGIEERNNELQRQYEEWLVLRESPDYVDRLKEMFAQEFERIMTTRTYDVLPDEIADKIITRPFAERDKHGD